ncbi:hypothetical protein CAPTEDRAFT_174489 [Capitella teleta]|uniref:Aromatic amino acid beta-eliminating lyase/threonine aldolase domain-containing protein n=1 Tax=Capitella teleta TaxID=283909 RepID=R7V092_CAPTE|nr:hypothetical protein CAPTEDRAFT_174489 [Capitella teleta]|eukprot:ELU12248.1 hypothetical protein CAPTEDRAFT_174489 [Capitella teleta]
MKTVSGVNDVEVIDLRTDCLTKPTAAMRQAMAEGSAHDVVFNEDPTVNALQDRCASLFGKEAALFVPSGTMGNLIGVLTHCNGRGLEVLLGDLSHLVMYEQGGISQLGGVFARTMPTSSDGMFNVSDVDRYIRPRDDPHEPWTALICVENSHNNCGGKVLPLEHLAQVRAKAEEHHVPVHMDGARVMNAIISQGVEATDVLKHVDSVSVCLSKGVGAPVGSILAGSAEQIASAVRMRKVLGGGWRKPGGLANAAMVAMDGMHERISNDHKNAQRLAKGIMQKSHNLVNIDLTGVHTNIVMVDTVHPKLTAQQLCDRVAMVTDREQSELKEAIVIKSYAFFKNTVRFCTYGDIHADHVNVALKKIHYVLDEFNEQLN